MKHIHTFSIGINRDIPDGFAISAEAVDKLINEVWIDCFKSAMLDAIKAGVKLPRYINITGTIEIDELSLEFQNGTI